MSGMAGGFMGGMIGNMFFGRPGYGSSGSGMGLLDLIVLVLIFFWVWRFIKKRRPDIFQNTSQSQPYDDASGMGPAESLRSGEVEEGLQRFRMTDPGFSEEALKEKFQDIFFRVQAAWMNRKLDGIYGMLAPEMVAYFGEEFKGMKNLGQINRLENIAIRKVEFTEIWQEEGRDYVTALITANLLDYTEDEHTGQLVSGDRLNPVKFEEFWTFCRDLGSFDWQLTSIGQVGQAQGR
ncbi:MAG: Tim44 domain-containing protein [Syntrophobacteraceae bacterium]|nr:Tim44 domain-containing protein [Syntrophobacteraceae bacterium]